MNPSNIFDHVNKQYNNNISHCGATTVSSLQTVSIIISNLDKIKISYHEKKSKDKNNLCCEHSQETERICNQKAVKQLNVLNANYDDDRSYDTIVSITKNLSNKYLSESDQRLIKKNNESINNENDESSVKIIFESIPPPKHCCQRNIDSIISTSNINQNNTFIQNAELYEDDDDSISTTENCSCSNSDLDEDSSTISSLSMYSQESDLTSIDDDDVNDYEFYSSNDCELVSDNKRTRRVTFGTVIIHHFYEFHD